MPGNGLKWYWRFGADPVTVNGPFDTRGDAITAARAAVARDGSSRLTMTICEGRVGELTDDIFEAEAVLAAFEEWNDDVFGEEPAIIATPEQQQELSRDLAAALRAWRKRHGFVRPRMLMPNRQEALELTAMPMRRYVVAADTSHG